MPQVPVGIGHARRQPDLVRATSFEHGVEMLWRSVGQTEHRPDVAGNHLRIFGDEWHRVSAFGIEYRTGGIAVGGIGDEAVECGRDKIDKFRESPSGYENDAPTVGARNDRA